MKSLSIAFVSIIAFVSVLGGCASRQCCGGGTAVGREKEFRRQLGESIPVKAYGYDVKELRFSKDHTKALVVFAHPTQRDVLDNLARRPDWEFVLKEDEFGRYRGASSQPFYTPGTANTPSVAVTVTFPPE